MIPLEQDMSPEKENLIEILIKVRETNLTIKFHHVVLFLLSELKNLPLP